MKELDVQRFSNDEAGYQLWVLRHPRGLVVPEKRQKAKLHYARCDHVSFFNSDWGPGGRYGYTTKPMLCFDNAAEFRAWAADSQLPPLPRCSSCSPALR